MLTTVALLASAGLHALAFPPWDFSFLAFVAITPFLIVIQRLTPGRALLAGHLWGSVAIWGVGGWVAEALTFYYQQPRWFGIVFCLVGCQILWGFYYALFAFAVNRIGPRLTSATRPPAIAVLWVACEFARAKLLTGEPWMLLGYALVPDRHLVQAADIGSVYLLSFVAILCNAALAELFAPLRSTRSRLVRVAALPAVVIAAVWSYGSWRLRSQFPQEPRVSVDVIQGNNDLGTQWRQEFYGAGLEHYINLSRPIAKRPAPRLLVWPESALTFFLAREPSFQQPLAELLRWSDADLIVGAPHRSGPEGDPHFFNSAFYVDSQGEITSRYDKAHLLPFAEYFPLRFIDLLRRNFERVRFFTPGDGKTLLQTRFGTAAVVICLEAIFPEIVRQQMLGGAQLLFNLSNDVWLGHGIGQAQHLSMVRLRAVENRVWVVRATTTGISAIIDPYGDLQRRSELFTEAVLEGFVVPMQVETFYKSHGDVFAYACVAAAIAIALVARRRGPSAIS